MRGMNWFLPRIRKISDSRPKKFSAGIRGLTVGSPGTLIGKADPKIFNPVFEKGRFFLSGIKICLKL